MSKLPEGISEQEVHTIGSLAATMVTQAIESKMAWDHAVTALGMAAKSLAVGMPWDDHVLRIAHAQKAFAVGFNLTARIAYVDANGKSIEIASPADATQKLSVPGVQSRIVID